MILTLDDYHSIYVGAKRKTKTQLTLSAFLREHSFKYVENHILEHYKTKLNIKPQHEKWNFLVIELSDGTYDDFLAFGIKLKGKHSPKVHVYLNYHFLETWEVPIGVDHKNWRKPKHRFKYSAGMPYEDRKAWKLEHTRLETGKQDKPSKFYTQNKKFVRFL